jgi:hypothetical protein
MLTYHLYLTSEVPQTGLVELEYAETFTTLGRLDGRGIDR